MANPIGNMVIKVDLDGSGFNKGIAGLDRQMRMVSREMSANLSKFGRYDQSLEKSKVKVDGLTKRQQVQAQKVKELKQQYDQLSKETGENSAKTQAAAAKYNEAYAELNKYERELNEATTEMKRLETQQRALNTTMGKIGSKFSELGPRLQEIGSKMQSVGRNMSMYVSAPIVAGFGVAVKASVDYEQAIAGVAKTTNMSGKELNNMSDKIMDMSKNMPFAATEIAGVAEAAGQLGVKKSEITDFTKTMLDMGVATNLTANEAATEFARFANAAKMPISDVDRLGSTVTALGNTTATTEKEIVEMGQRLAGAGAQAGFSANQIMSVSAAMSSAGIEAEAGGTAMTQIMNKMTKAAANGGAELESFAKTSGMSAEEFAQTWESNPSKALSAFVKGLSQTKGGAKGVIAALDQVGIKGVREADTIRRMANNHQLLDGALKTGADAWKKNTALTNEANTRYKTMGSQLQIFKNQLIALAIDIGNVIAPVVVAITKKLGEWAQKFTELPTPIKGVAIGLGLVAAAIGPLLMALGVMVSTIGSAMTVIGPLMTSIKTLSFITKGWALATGFLNTILGVARGQIALQTVLTGKYSLVTKTAALVTRGLGLAIRFMTGPIGLVITAVGLLVAGVIHLWKTNEGFRNAVIKIWKNIQTALSTVVKATKDFILNSWKFIRDGSIAIFNSLKKGLSSIFNGLKLYFKTVLAAYKLIFNVMFNVIKKVVLTIVRLMTKGIRTSWTNLKNFTSSIFNSIRNFLLKTWSNIRTSVVKIIVNMYRSIRNTWSNLSRNTRNLYTNLRNWLINLWTKLRHSIVRQVRLMWDRVRKSFNNLYSGTRSIFNRVKNSIVNVWNSIKRSVTGIVSRLWGSVRRTFNNMKNGLGNIIGKIKSHIGGMVSKIKSGLNSLIRGLNWVGSKLSLPKIPTLSTGTQRINRHIKTTHDGRLKHGTMAVVGDKGPGNGRGIDGRRELIQYPNGRTALTPAKDTTTWLPKGSRVISGSMRQQMTGELPRFSMGTWFGKATDWIGSKMRSAGDWLKDRLGDVLDFVGKPSKLLNKLLSSLGIDFGSLTKGMGIVGQITRGAWNKIKDGAIKWLKGGLDSAGGDIKGGILDPRLINYHFGHTAAYTAATGRPFHEGVDFPFVYKTIRTPMGGKVARQSFMHGGYGNWVKVISGAMEMIFAHLRDFSKTPPSGKTVKAGDVIGLTGNTGFSTGPHLHLGIRKNGRDVDPEPYLWRAQRQGRLKVSGKGGGGLGRITETVKTALNQTGLPTTKRFVDFWSKKINEKDGTGLLDISKSTFEAFKAKGHDKYNNTLDNLMAGMRYAKVNYGSGLLDKAKRFASGGLIKNSGWYNLAEDGYPEWIIPTDPSRASDAAKLLALASKDISKNKRPKNFNSSAIGNDNNGNSKLESKLDTMIGLLIKLVGSNEEIADKDYTPIIDNFGLKDFINATMDKRERDNSRKTRYGGGALI
ncbi:phage tail tape measure protein [Staphylococcus delphini]|uniref:phage tail tape measure protein n=1 Tax=Staphylococcus delphini TaxID=53344 RepID=UPI0021CE2DC4|nr:phage tail tape measure protein [Staphylococcus delphini]UXS56986.1 phage tail tape measure protein [Staphylococcus delphini]